jgi:hypothetical protein
VPFSALRLAKKLDATVLVVDKTAKEMAACVKYTKPKNGIIDEKTAASCCESMRAKATIGSEDNQ